MSTALTQADEFEGRLRYIAWLALFAALLHKATAWLGAGALTWSTVVLMGGFASAISFPDFKLITGLVVLVVFLLALSLFSVTFITKKTLCAGSIDPVRYTYRDNRPRFVTLLEFLSHFLQLLIIIVCLWLSITKIRTPDFQSMHMKIYFHNAQPLSSSSNASTAAAAAAPPSPAAALQACLENCFSAAIYNSNATMAAICAPVCVASTASAPAGSNNLEVCLFSFFVLVIATALCGALCLMYRWMVKPLLWKILVGDGQCLSLSRYHDEVLSRALNLGFAEGDEIEVREFLLRAVGEDLMIRNIGPLEVRRKNREVIEYLYNHPKGPEMVYQGLESEDTLLQQAAANIVGFWAAGNLKLDVHLELLSRLGSKLGLPGKAAEGAANSFSAVAHQWQNQTPSPLLSVRVPLSGVAAGAAPPRHGAASGRGAAVPEKGSSPTIRASDGAAVARGSAAVLSDGVAAGEGIAAPVDVAAAGGGSSQPAYCVPAGGGAALVADDAARGQGNSTADGAAVAAGAERGGDTVLVDGAAKRGEAAVGGANVPGGGDLVADGEAAGGGGGEGGGAVEPVEGRAAEGGAVEPVEGRAAEGARGGDGDVEAEGEGAKSGEEEGRERGGGASGGAGGSGAGGGGGYNVVDRVVDIILQRRAPTLLVYVRTLESFLMSESIREHVSRMGQKGRVEEKLEEIIRKEGSRMEPRTRLLALFALCRMRSSDGRMQIQGGEQREAMERLLTLVDQHFTDHFRGSADAGQKILWFTEVDHYKVLCTHLRGATKFGAWLSRCIINGKDLQ